MKASKSLWLCLCFCLCLLSGCSHDHGSFQDGDLDMAYVMTQLNASISDGSLKMGILNDEAVSKQEIEEQYALDMTKIQDCRIQRSVIAAQLSEIALFKADKQADGMLKEAIKQYKETLRKQWGDEIMNADALITSSRQGRIGQYYYFVLGDDAKKVVHYMQELK